MKLFFAVLLFMPAFAFGQQLDSARVSDHGLAIGPVFSPDFDYRYLRSDPSFSFVKDARDKIEIPKFGFTAGIDLLFHLHRKFILSTGLRYSGKGFNTKEIDIVSTQAASPVRTSAEYHYQYLDIPLKINYPFARISNIRLGFLKKPLHGKAIVSDMSLFFSGGVTSSILLGQKSSTLLIYSNGYSYRTPYKEKDCSALNFAATAGIGMNYQLGPRLMFQAEPVFLYALNAIAKTPVREYPWSLGLNVCVYYFVHWKS